MGMKYVKRGTSHADVQRTWPHRASQVTYSKLVLTTDSPPTSSSASCPSGLSLKSSPQAARGAGSQQGDASRPAGGTSKKNLAKCAHRAHLRPPATPKPPAAPAAARVPPLV